MAVNALLCIAYMLCTQGWRNYTLFILLVSILAYGAGLVVYELAYIQESQYAPLLVSICFAVGGSIHWLITQSYIKVAYETSFILDRGVLLNDPVKLNTVRLFKRNI